MSTERAERGGFEEGGLSVLLVGATGAVGRDLLDALALSRISVGSLRLVASPSSRMETVEAFGRSHTVNSVPADIEALAEGVDLAIFACPPEVTQKIAPVLAEEGVPCIDVGGALAGSSQLVIPAVNLGALEGFRDLPIVCSPSAPAVLLAHVLAPLSRFGISAVRGTVSLSAGSAGKAGIEELSRQVVTLFNHGEPPRVVFPNGLAFDVISAVGEVGPNLWTSAEGRLAEETAAVLQIPKNRIGVGLQVAPIFAGVTASLHVSFAEEPALEDVVRLLADSGSLKVGDPVPGPRRLAGRAVACVGRVRRDPLGDGVHLFAAADNLRFGATVNIITLIGALQRLAFL